MTALKTCPRCHVSKPLDAFTRDKTRRDGLNPYCRDCTRELSAAHHAKNPDATKKRGAEWYAANKDRRREKVKAWLSNNPGKAAEYSKAWRDKNPGKGNELSRKWYRENREAALAADKKARQENIEMFLERERRSLAKRAPRKAQTAKIWRENNRAVVAFHAAKRRAAIAERTPGWLTSSDFSTILEVFKRAAELSQATGEPHHVDHIVPLRGKTVSGLNVPWNLQVLPATENLRKNNRHAA